MLQVDIWEALRGDSPSSLSPHSSASSDTPPTGYPVDEDAMLQR